MAKKRITSPGKTTLSEQGSAASGAPIAEPAVESPVTGEISGVYGAEFTGRFLMLLPEKGAQATMRSLNSIAGMSVASSEDFTESGVDVESLGGAEALLFAELGVVVMDAPPDKTHAMMAAVAAEGTEGMIVEPERYVYPLSELDYYRGYRDGIDDLTRRILGTPGGGAAPGFGGYQPPSGSFPPTGAFPPTPPMPGFQPYPDITARFDGTAVTWGLQAVGADRSSRTGAGISVAVLDTGLDLRHPDFEGRAITPLSFVSDEDAQDVLGHGSHCIGTACGPRTVLAPNIPRYGIAWQAEIVVGKVFDRITRRAPDARILAGIAEAVRRKCAVVSMSLGAPVVVGQPFNAVMENAAARALAAGTLIIAAAGNDSHRPGDIRPVSHPANCPSIMAVAAVDSTMRVAPFSNGGVNPTGGKVDICGPGISVFSSWPMPTRYRTIDGTSMATPHVAGCAALHAQASGLRGGALWRGWFLLRVHCRFPQATWEQAWFKHLHEAWSRIRGWLSIQQSKSLGTWLLKFEAALWLLN